MDTTAVLEKYTQDLSNLPLEVRHLFDELKAKDTYLQEVRRRYQSRDTQLHKFIKANGTLIKHPKEQVLTQKIEEDMVLVQKIQKEKILIANTALFLISKHMYNFEADVQKLEKDDLLAPAENDDLEDSDDDTLTARATPDPVRKKRTYSVMKNRYKRPKSEDYYVDDEVLSGPSSRHTSAAVQSHVRVSGGDDTDNNLYCFCQRVSFGEMIGCDNDDCKFEWFHWSCVGITSPPKDDKVWYCPDCAPKMEKRKKRRR